MSPEGIALYFWPDSGVYIADLAKLLDTAFVGVLRVCTVIRCVLVHDAMQQEDGLFRDVGHIATCLRSFSNGS